MVHSRIPGVAGIARTGGLMSGRSDSVLERLAMMAGLKRVWQDALGREQVVSPDTLRSVLETLGFACQGEAQCRESLASLEASNASNDAKGLEIIQLGKPLELGRQGTSHYQMQSEEHTSELQSRENLVCRLLLEKKK